MAKTLREIDDYVNLTYNLDLDVCNPLRDLGATRIADLIESHAATIESLQEEVDTAVMQTDSAETDTQELQHTIDNIADGLNDIRWNIHENAGRLSKDKVMTWVEELMREFNMYIREH